MIKCYTFENFKSFEKAELNLEAFTTLVGTNASGKSNAIEGIKILSEVSTGIDLSVALDGTKNIESNIRGGSKSCPRFRTNSFKLGCLISLDENNDLLYEIKIGVKNKVLVEEEALYKVKVDQIGPRTNIIFKAKKPSIEDGTDINVEYRREKNNDLVCVRTSAILPQLQAKLPRENAEEKENIEMIELVIKNLKNVIILDPVPQEMRGYTRISDSDLRVNCDNISAVMNQMCKDKSTKEKLLSIISKLPENEVTDIEFVETIIGDVIFGLREKYLNSTELVDARKLSDGTLRCIAMITAALVSEQNSVIVIEEIDNGIHPGRVQKLVETLSQIGQERNIDIIITTHNAMMLNHYNKENLIGVSIVYREKEKGTSKFVSFVDLENFPNILASGGLGNAMIDNTLMDSIKNEKKNPDYSWIGV